MAQQGVVAQILEDLVSRHGGPRLRHLCESCVQGLDVDGVSVSVMSGDSARELLCASDPIALRAEQLQFTVGEGPCLHAYRTGWPVIVADVSTDGHWPAYMEALGEHAPRVRAVYGFPLAAGPVRIGAMNLYRFSAGEPGATQIVQMAQACDTAVSAILQALPDELGDDESVVAHFRDYAVIDRSAVYQATGLIMLDLGVSAQEALARLRAYAQSQGRLVEDLARAVVTHGTRLTR